MITQDTGPDLRHHPVWGAPALTVVDRRNATATYSSYVTFCPGVNDAISDQIRGYGLVQLDPLDTARLFDRCPRSLFSVRQTTGFSDVLEHLDVLTWPATRYVLFPVGDAWTGVITNGKYGTEFADDQGWMSFQTKARTIRVVDSPREVYRRGEFRVVTSYEARMVEMRDGEKLVRSIGCSDDGGRWTFSTSGEALPVEATFAYDARRKKDRFTPENLADFLRAAGPGPLSVDLVAEASLWLLLTENIDDTTWPTKVATYTREQARDPAHGYFERALGWTRHMRTHAGSVVVDMTSAVLLNPAYEPKVRKYLRRARWQLGRQAYARHVDMARDALTKRT